MESLCLQTLVNRNPLVPGSSPGGPTNNLNTNSRIGIFLSAERMTK